MKPTKSHQKPNPNECLQIIRECAYEISSSQWIPGYDKQDIQQEAIIIGLEYLEKDNYSGKIPFKNYIANHMRHRLRSLRRSKFVRSNCNCGNYSQCINCRNTVERQKINLPENIEEYWEDSSMCYVPRDTLIEDELREKIDKNIPAEYREDYLKMLAGVKVSYPRRVKIKQILLSIINDEEF